jgi:hypothetical protein
MNLSGNIPFAAASAASLSVRSPLRLGIVNVSGVLPTGVIQ